VAETWTTDNFHARETGGAPMQGVRVNFFLIRTFVSDRNVELLEKYLVNLQMTGTDLTETVSGQASNSPLGTAVNDQTRAFSQRFYSKLFGA
jgi:hypothetical protein